jgi:hypothetical protein
MIRSTFVAGSVAFSSIPCSVNAQSPSTIVAASCNDPDDAELVENLLVNALRSKNVRCVDPSAVSLMQHTEARLIARRVLGGIEIDYSSLSWVTTDYGAARILLASLGLHERQISYGEFVVYDYRCLLSARCLEVHLKELVGSAAVSRSAKSEDADRTRYDVIRDSVAALAIQLASELSR